MEAITEKTRIRLEDITAEIAEIVETETAKPAIKLDFAKLVRGCKIRQEVSDLGEALKGMKLVNAEKRSYAVKPSNLGSYDQGMYDFAMALGSKIRDFKAKVYR